MQISIVVCTYNPDLSLLRRVLSAACAQLDSAAIEGEVIIIDNNSDPALDAAALTATYQLRVVQEPTPGLTAARETAIGEAVGGVILFVDDDNVLEHGYVAAVLKEFAREDRVGLLGGSILPEYDDDRAAWLGDLRSMLAVRPYDSHSRFETTAPPYNELFPIGAGIAIRRQLAADYVEDCAATSRIQGRRGTALSSGEDLDMGLFVLSRGYKLVVTGKAAVTHVIADSRLSPDYIVRLAIANVNTASNLEAKWAPRMSSPIFPILYQPIAPTLAKLVASSALGLFSKRMRVKAALFRALLARRLRGSPIHELLTAFMTYSQHRP